MKKIIFVIIFTVLAYSVKESLYPYLLYAGLNFSKINNIQNLNSMSSSENTNSNKSISLNDNSTSDTIEIKALYAMGKLPMQWGMPDTVIIRLCKTILGSRPIRLNLKINNLVMTSTIYDTTYYINKKNIFDTLIYHKLPVFFDPQNDLIIVQALPGDVSGPSLLDNAVYDEKQYYQDITSDKYNYADPSLEDDGAIGFDNKTGNFVAGFNNNNTTPLLISSVEENFFDSLGGGNHPYRLVIYGDNGSGKPGELLYISPALTTPQGLGTPQKVIYNIDSPVNISASSRFFVGYRQTSAANIHASYQSEIPVRSKSFFLSSPDTSNKWSDFHDSSYNYRLDLSPVVGSGILRLTVIMEGFYNSFSKKLNMRDTLRTYLKKSRAPFTIVDSAISVIDSVSFTGNFTFRNAVTGSYFIVVKHRNSIQTWSGIPIRYITGEITSYNFTTSAAQAYGNNMSQVDNMPVRYGLYSGDVNQDGVVDGTDFGMIDNDANNFVVGYVLTDLNGNGFVDASDIVYYDNEVYNFIGVISP